MRIKYYHYINTVIFFQSDDTKLYVGINKDIKREIKFAKEEKIIKIKVNSD